VNRRNAVYWVCVWEIEQSENVEAVGDSINPLRSVSTTRVHDQSSRAELTARELGCIFDTRQLGTRAWRVSKNATWAVNSGSGNRPLEYRCRHTGDVWSQKIYLSTSRFRCKSSALNVTSESRSVFNSTSRATFSRDLAAMSDSQCDLRSDISPSSLAYKQCQRYSTATAIAAVTILNTPLSRNKHQQCNFTMRLAITKGKGKGRFV